VGKEVSDSGQINDKKGKKASQNEGTKLMRTGEWNDSDDVLT
jgi:hypothetical protein